MPVSPGDIIRVQVSGVLAIAPGSQCQNDFWYEVTPDGASFASINDQFAEDFWNAMYDSIFDPLLNVIYSSFSYLECRVDGWNVPGNPFGVHAISNGQGQYAIGQMLPIFNAWAFRLNRGSRATRNGQKRFPAIPEDLANNGNATPDALATLTAVASAMESTLTVDSGLLGDSIWQPVIVRKAPVGFSILASQPVASAVYSRISTQNTRKR